MSFKTTNLHKILYKLQVFKSHSITPRKNWIKNSDKYAHLPIISFINTKFYEILFWGLREVALTNCFSSIHVFNLVKFLTLKLQEKIIDSKFPANIHLYTVCPLNYKVQVLFRGFRGVALTSCFNSILNFGQISEFKKGIIPRKKNWIKISCKYVH